MRAQGIFGLLAATGLPVAYRNWVGTDGGAPPARPYLVYYEEGTSDLYADDGNYASVKQWCVELYTDQKDEKSEAAVEAALKGAEIACSKNEVGPAADKAPLLTTYRFQTLWEEI